ncbi:MAG: hypothetical protein NVS2B15_08070 [Pseudarthrobacter sp.]
MSYVSGSAAGEEPELARLPDIGPRCPCLRCLYQGCPAKRVPWRKIAETTSISRIEAIRLAHSLDGVLAEIREDEDIGNQKNETADPLPERPLPPSSA